VVVLFLLNHGRKHTGPLGGSLQVRVLTHASNPETLVLKAKRYSRLRLRIINHPYRVARKRLISGIPTGFRKAVFCICSDITKENCILLINIYIIEKLSLRVL
jgi:hypothetical protein